MRICLAHSYGSSLILNEIHTVASLTVGKMKINTLKSLTNCSHIVVGIPSTISTVVCCGIITLCFM